MIQRPSLKRAAVAVFVAISVYCDVIAIAKLHAQPEVPRGHIPPSLQPALREKLEDLYSTNPLTRGKAAYSLDSISFGPDELTLAIPFLVGMLDDLAPLERRLPGDLFGGVPTSPGKIASDNLVQRALSGLRFSGDALTALLGFLNSGSPTVRQHAAAVLSVLRDSRALPAVIAALSDSDRIVRSYLAQALRNQTGMDFGEDQAAWGEWWEQNKDRVRQR